MAVDNIETVNQEVYYDDRIPYGSRIPYVSPTGRMTYLFNIGTLANLLGRNTQTIRKWEVAGIIPPTPFKAASRRLYSQEHMNAIIRLAEKYHLGVGRKVSPVFIREIFKKFREINRLFFGGEMNELKEESK